MTGGELPTGGSALGGPALGGPAGLVVLSGVHAVKHAVRFGAELESVVSADPDAALALLATVAPDVVLSVRPVPPAEIVRLAGAPVDLVGLARRPRDVPAGPGPAVLLDNPRHLGNLGAVVRVAAGFGARAVLSTGTVDPWHPTVVRAAAGLHWAVPVRRVTDVPSGLIAFDADGEDLRGVPIPDDATLAFGSERHGLSAAVRARAARVVAIPIRDRVSSYNLATSVAVALYAWTARTGAR
ncbi:MAG TPA: TrmH family RNA methyltransferase [Mycobacteriales bacterium]|nr:TrmH family RNA methyltransferase [Mycobacteriales bacterium]